MNTAISFIHRHALPLFFSASILLAAPVFLALTPQTPAALALLYLLLGSYIPAIAAVVMLALTGDLEERDLFRRRLGRLRVSIRWYLAAFLIPSILWLVGAGIHKLLGGEIALQPSAFAFFPVILITNLGEEIGWRGYALPRLMKRFSPLTASLLLGLVWALYHAALYMQRPVFGLLTALLILAISVLLTWIFLGSGGSIWLTAMFHAVVNTFSQVYLAAPGPERLLGTICVLFILAALVLVWRLGARLSPQPGAGIER